MSQSARRRIFLSGLSVALLLAGAYSIVLLTAKAATQDEAASTGIRDVGPFKVGFKRGLERASFTGRPLVKVFVPAWDDAAFEPVAQLLADPGLVAAMQGFTGVIVPVPQEEKLSEADLETLAIAREERIQAAIAAGETLPAEDSTPRFPAEQLPVVVIQSLRGPFLAVASLRKLLLCG